MSIPLDDWQARGACRPYPPAWWFPVQARDGARGIAICATCTVHVECLAAGQRESEPTGIWGGVDLTHRNTSAARRRGVGRPRTPWRTAIDGVLADEHWHTFDDIVAEAGPTVTDQTAFEGLLARSKSQGHTPPVWPIDTTTRARGQRFVIRRTISTMVKKLLVEIDPVTRRYRKAKP